jgi:beta-lactamase class A
MKRYRFRNERLYRRRRRTIALILITLVLLAVSYWYFLRDDNPVSTNSPTPTSTETASPEPQSTDTPSVEPTPTIDPTPEPTPDPKGTYTQDHGFLPAIGSVEKSGKADDIKAKVQDYISKQTAKYGVYFIDLATGESFGINDRDEYVAASTSKLPMNVYLYTKIEAGEISFDTVLKYLKEDFEPGTGIIQNKPYGTEYTVRETSRLSIIHSDNCAINMIIRICGIDNICQYILDLGGDIWYDKRHRTSPHDLALVTQELYRLYLNNPELYGLLINDLENTDWKDRIDAKLPKDVKVAHKIGNQGAYNTFNDVGIVFASHPYVLAVMSEKTNYDTACKGISEISKIIYDEVEAYAAQ